MLVDAIVVVKMIIATVDVVVMKIAIADAKKVMNVLVVVIVLAGMIVIAEMKNMNVNVHLKKFIDI